MAKILGKYRSFEYEHIMKYGEVPEHYRKLLNFVYGANDKDGNPIPMDILASMLEIISYPRFIRNFVADTGATELEYGEPHKLIDKEILKTQFSKNLLDGMIKYNTIPYQLEPHTVVFLTPEVDVIDSTSAEFIMFRRSIMEQLNRTEQDIRIKRGSNLLFQRSLYILQKMKPFTIKDIEITYQQIFQKIAIDAIIRKATDIYIDPKPDRVNINFSIFNEMVRHTTYPFTRIETKNFVNSIIKECGIAADKIDWAAEGGRADYKMLDLGEMNGRYEGRVNVTITPIENVVSPVIRIHDTGRTMQKMQDLKINREPKEKLKEIVRNQNGLFIIAGGTGQGKSTTLYSCIDHMLETRPGDRIEEMSDPIEMQIDAISQLKLNTEEGLTFEGLSQSTTRRNPKIIFLGEINSDGSAEFAVDQAIKDLFLITTTHAGSASMIPARIQGLTLREPFIYKEFMNLIKGVAHQKMLKKACPHCCREVPVADIGKNNADILRAYDYTKKTVLREYPDPDCEVCEGRGYLVSSPVVCLEVLAITDTVRQKIFDAPGGIQDPRLAIELELRDQQMSGINDAFRYLKDNVVSFDMIYRGYSLFNLNEELILSQKRG